jgi:protein TonB
MSLRRHIPKLIGGAAVVLFGFGIITFIQSMLDAPPPPKRPVQQITLVTPPPPPPKIEEQPPEPEIEEKVDIPEPEAMEELPDAPSDAPPAGDALGVDADGGAGGDGFGLIGRKGGRGLLDGGGPFAGYASRLQQSIERVMTEDNDLRKNAYSVIVKLWLSPAGDVARAELARSTGQPALDDLLTRKLESVRVADAPPLEMPQPVRLRISVRL